MDTAGVQSGSHPFLAPQPRGKATKVICNMADKCGAKGLHSSLDRPCAHAIWHKQAATCDGVCPQAVAKGLEQPSCKERDES